jgi:hypothetical protein
MARTTEARSEAVHHRTRMLTQEASRLQGSASGGGSASTPSSSETVSTISAQTRSISSA